MTVSHTLDRPVEPAVDKRTDGPGASVIDPGAAAAPMYRLLAEMRTPVALRDMMILPIRTGYIGEDREMDPSVLPPSAEDVYPDVEVGEVFCRRPMVPSGARHSSVPTQPICGRC